MRYPGDFGHLRHHAFVIEAEAQTGIERAQSWVERELQMQSKGNPDVVMLCHGLLSVGDARRVSAVAAGAPFSGDHKVIIITADRAYHEAQNALLKLFEEPPSGTYLFLILPSLGGLLPTLRSRVHALDVSEGRTASFVTEDAKIFLKAGKEKRSALIKKLASGKDDDQRRGYREEAIAILNGIEAAAYVQIRQDGRAALLSDIAVLRDHLYDRSAPVRMILEHLALVIPKDLSASR